MVIFDLLAAVCVIRCLEVGAEPNFAFQMCTLQVIGRVASFGLGHFWRFGGVKSGEDEVWGGGETSARYGATKFTPSKQPFLQGS